MEPLRDVIAEAVTWCVPRADLKDPAGSLRRLPDPVQYVGHLNAYPERVVEALVDSRRQALRGTPERIPGLAGGRLLAYLPDEELSDGAAEEETRGFFDVNNAPPRDTWIRHAMLNGKRVLVAYVPAVFLPSVERGIYVNPEQCILWLDEAGHQALGVAALLS